ncbi:hypothetical protein BCV33_12000 [Vibrio lentus]|uniref:hypothetical protein n=1 Tax=Vibrio lentus TaxID=136468 RepID=UPI000C84972C|nr:hypothetical protein [Vibrio lentus]PME57465.1 hypothetical protein BCV33_12000 [Vibrio lentus]
MINRYTFFAFLSISLVFGSYVSHFYINLNYGLSDSVEVWAQLGDYAGGLLNPILSFISLVLLIKSLNLQNQANIDLRNELKINEKTEKLRSFETHFFNMINSQKVAFDSFELVFTDEVKVSVIAVMAIEDQIEEILEDSINRTHAVTAIEHLLDKLDDTDRIFSAIRIFYIMVKMVDDKLSTENDFSISDRKTHLRTLINFTEFSLLRLIMISMQFLDCHPAEYLKHHDEFNEVLNEVGLKYDLY